MEGSADKEEKSKANTNEEMAPKNGYEPTTGNSSNSNVEEDDLQELAAVNDSLDELSSVLDFFEQRTDNIIEQLKELLHSNREMRAELALEKAAAALASLNDQQDHDAMES